MVLCVCVTFSVYAVRYLNLVAICSVAVDRRDGWRNVDKEQCTCTAAAAVGIALFRFLFLLEDVYLTLVEAELLQVQRHCVLVLWRTAEEDGDRRTRIRQESLQQLLVQLSHERRAQRAFVVGAGAGQDVVELKAAWVDVGERFELVQCDDVLERRVAVEKRDACDVLDGLEGRANELDHGRDPAPTGEQHQVRGALAALPARDRTGRWVPDGAVRSAHLDLGARFERVQVASHDSVGVHLDEQIK